MTREEAIEVLQQDIPCEQDTDLIEALEMAIEALSAEPCEDAISRDYLLSVAYTDGAYGYVSAHDIAKAPSVNPKVVECEDAISRAWIKESIHNLYHYSRHTPTEEDIQEYIVDDALPVTPKPKMGRWIPVSEKLPEGEQSVLFCDIDGDIMVGYHVEGRPNTHFSQEGTFEDMKNVMAWMPLPEPCKAESEENIGPNKKG